jgi:hypothetical protein
MRFILIYFLKRLPRDGFKSLSVPALAFTLAFLINLPIGFVQWQEDEYANIMDNYPIIAELADNLGVETDGIYVNQSYLDLFTDPEALFSLYGYVKDVLLKREMLISEIAGRHAEIPLIGITRDIASYMDDTNEDIIQVSYFSENQKQSNMQGNEYICLISEDLIDYIQDGMLHITVRSTLSGARAVMLGITPDEENEPRSIPISLTVIGTVSNTASTVFAPFRTVSELGTASDGFPPHTDRLQATLNDNRDLIRFKEHAWRTFLPMTYTVGGRPYTLVVYDSVFYDLIETIQQNIYIIQIIEPFIFYLVLSAGFVASLIITRRRKPEFAIMRSIGVNKWTIFFGVFIEQALLTAAGIIISILFFFWTWGYMLIELTLILFACYMLGAVISSINAAGTDVLKILRERE